MPEAHRHQVVVIGSGFGGLFATKELRHADVDITLIAKTTHHLFQPLLYQVATGILSEGEIAQLAQRTLKKDFRRINTREGKVILLDAADQVLPAFGEHLGGKAEARLRKLGVDVELGAKVIDVDERGIEVEYLADGSRK